MINILILSAGTRVKVVEYFKKELKGKGNIIVADCSELAPTLYVADKHYIVPRISERNYLSVILDICKKENVKALFSLIDPELSLISKNKEIFISNGILPIVSEYETVEKCFDKYKLFLSCKENNISVVQSYISYESFLDAYDKNKIQFPVFVKPYNGSCSNNIKKIDSLDELELILKIDENLMIQEYMDGQEYGVDVYIDLVSNNIISIFAKKKLLMRAGETDKSVSIKNSKLFDLITNFVSTLDFRGQIDIDVFEKDGDFFISEVNPRFGGGYLHAYECGCNFPKFLINNLEGKVNQPCIGEYEEDIYMMKYLDLLIGKNIDGFNSN